jgi:non-heme chloroperoxidase
MSIITVKDGTTIYYKDWGKGPVVTFSHGWPLNSDAWDGQMLFLAQNDSVSVASRHGRRLLWRCRSRSREAICRNDRRDHTESVVPRLLVPVSKNDENPESITHGTISPN